jgi:predicted nucleic acid-binding protein
VLDASVVVQWFVPEGGSGSSIALLESTRSLVAPDLMPLEVANALWKKARRGEFPESDLTPSIARLLDGQIVLASTVTLLSRASRLAVQSGHPVYDCVYLVLAAERGALLATTDARLGRTATAQGIRLWRA